MSTLKKIAPIMVAALVILAGCADDRDRDVDMTDTTDTMDMDMTRPTAGGDSLRATLSGAAEVPGPGDSDGSGTASIGLNQADNTLCFNIQVQGIGEPTAAHIHSGGPASSGPPVVDLAIATNGLSGCVQADAAMVDSIWANPDSFYVNVHTAEFGAGAVRGQLGSGMGM